MARKRTAEKARPQGRKKPAAKASKKTARTVSKATALKKKTAPKKKAKLAPRKASGAKKAAVKKGSKAKVATKAKSKPLKVIEPAPKKLAVAKPAPKTAAKSNAKQPVKGPAPSKSMPAPKASPAGPVKTVPTALKAAPQKQKEVDTLVAPRPTPRPTPTPPAPVVMKKALKEKVTIEFMVNSSPAVLYEMISSPSGFAEWYCTDVNVRGDQYTFIWPDEQESTTLIGRKLGEVIRFHRNDDDDEGSYFEFRVRIDAMTNEVALIVTDHAWPAEVEETRNLWNSQIASLLRVLGA